MTAPAEDEALLAELRSVAGRADPIPDLVDQAAREAFTWRTIDAELAALAYDSATAAAPLAGVRGPSATRSLSFELDDVSIAIEVSGPHGDRRLFGQVSPPAAVAVTLRHPHGTQEGHADELGRFTCDAVPPGPCSLRLTLPGDRVVQTEWTVL